MKWFKHISDSLDDPFIFDLMERFGSDGYLVFFGTLEVYAREFKAAQRWKLNVSADYLRRKLHLKAPERMLEVLQYITKKKKWRVRLNDDRVEVRIPKFHELLDNTMLATVKGRVYSGKDSSWYGVAREIRARDNFCCVHCSKTTEENKRSLSVHHIVPLVQFKNPARANEPSNLVSLCVPCHSLAGKGTLDDFLKSYQSKVLAESSAESSTESSIKSSALDKEEEVEVEEDKEKHKTYGAGEDFEKFWTAYPRTSGVSKANAKKAWRNTKGVPVETILEAVGWCKRHEWEGKEQKYIPHPSTWLNGKRWETCGDRQPKALTLSDAKADVRHLAVYPYPQDLDRWRAVLNDEDYEKFIQFCDERWPPKEEFADEDRQEAAAEIRKIVDDIGSSRK